MEKDLTPEAMEAPFATGVQENPFGQLEFLIFFALQFAELYVSEALQEFGVIPVAQQPLLEKEALVVPQLHFRPILEAILFQAGSWNCSFPSPPVELQSFL